MKGAREGSSWYGLRSWKEVAAEFTQRTGIRMTPAAAAVTCSRALRKMKRAMVRGNAKEHRS